MSLFKSQTDPDSSKNASGYASDVNDKDEEDVTEVSERI